MTHSLITRLVVGEPTTLTLGRPVEQSLAKRAGGALRWKEGTWVGTGTPRVDWLARVLRTRQPQAIIVRTTAAPPDSARARRRMASAALAAVAVGAAIPLAFSALHGEAVGPGDLPITPAATTAPVRVVTAAYVPPQPVPTPAGTPPLPIATPNDGAASPLPFAPPVAAPEPAAQPVAELPKAAPVAVERRPAAPTQAPMQKEQAPAPKNSPSNQREQQPVSAVVLDEASPRGARAGINPPAAAATAPAKTAASAPSVPAVASQPAPKPALERGTGLIAITPDSKVAVFTNPKTRLPQQFKIGEQLPSGDTIRGIDAKAGKVVSSSKEYTLD